MLGMETLVKRIDSANMERMYARTLESSDVAFLSESTDVTLEQVRRLKLGNEVEDTPPLKAQCRPPQPPKQSPQPTFFLNSFDFLLDDGDAESWLVAAPFDEKTHSKLKSAPLLDDKRETVVSPVDSNVSSDISRSSCLTPASVLETSRSRSIVDKETTPSLHGAQLAAGRRGDLGALLSDQTIDIRHLPRNNGSINHTPAPPLEAHVKSKSETAKVRRYSTGSECKLNQKKTSMTTIGSRLKDRISGNGVKESNKPKTSILKTRPRSIGPVQRPAVPAVSAVPRPKSSLGNSRTGTKSQRTSAQSQASASPPPRRPRSSLARPASALGTVREEKPEGKKMSRLRRMISPTPLQRPTSSLGRTKDENKTPKRSFVSRIASPVSRSKSSLGTPLEEKTKTKHTRGLSRLTPPSLRPPKSGMRTATVSKEKPTTLTGRRLSSSVPPTSQASRGRKDDTKSKAKGVQNKKRLET